MIRTVLSDESGSNQMYSEGVTWQMRLVLIAAMAGFLVMAMATPEVFGAGALTFGLSYLFVVVLHLGAFALKGGGIPFKATASSSPPPRSRS